MDIRKLIFAGIAALFIGHNAYADVAGQSWSYSYTDEGEVETVDGPRTDISDITTYNYDGSNRLTGITNALGQTRSVLEYDVAGRPLKEQDLNGLQTHYSYTARGWLKTITVKGNGGDLVTTYTYNSMGKVTGISYPDGSDVTFEYDDAHRLTAVENIFGERVEYTLDAASNIIEEKTFASDGSTLVRSISRNYDELSRLIDVDGNNGQNISLGYDKNGDRVSLTDGNQNTTSEARDALGRVHIFTDAAASQTEYIYDSADRIKSVIDPRGNTTSYEYDFTGNLTRLTSPDTGATEYEYDEAGNLKVRTDARSVVTHYACDALNRLTAISYPGNSDENAIFIYDSVINGNKGVGHLTGYSNDAGSTAITYNDLGWVTRKDDSIANFNFSTLYSYDSMGRVVKITYPSGRVVSYSRDAIGRINAITSKEDALAPSQTIVSNVEYQPYGSVKAITYGNGIIQNYTYDLDGRLESVQASGIGNVRSNYYSYDLANNITGIANLLDISKDRSFFYDNLNRVVDESYVEGQKSYEYDSVGNRTANTWTKVDESQEVSNYAYDSNSNRLIQKDSKTWILDAAGNLVSADDGHKQYTYNHANRLKTYTEGGTLQATYYYNALGQRVRTSTAVDNLLHYDLRGRYLGETNIAVNGADILSQVDYIYLDDLPIAQVKTQYNQSGQVQNSALTYLHADHINAPRIGTDGNQEIVWRWDSDAFGATEPNTDPDDDAEHTVINLRFPGQIKGSEATHYYNYFRDYDPSLGRYLQSDPIGLQGGINTYGYGEGNPLSFADPLGLFARPGTTRTRPGSTSNSTIGVDPVAPCLICSQEFPRMGAPYSPGESNVVPFPGNTKQKTENYDECPPDDSCLRRQIALNEEKAFMFDFWSSSAGFVDDGKRKVAYQNWAIKFNRRVSKHNLGCPNHKVAPVSTML